VDGGVQSMGYVKRMSDGMVLSTGYGFVGDDEKTWSKRPEFAKRAMAQTRGISRACRSAFSHVVTLMDAGLMTTPAEEMPGDGGGGGSQSATTKATTKQPPPLRTCRSRASGLPTPLVLASTRARPSGT